MKSLRKNTVQIQKGGKNKFKMASILMVTVLLVGVFLFAEAFIQTGDASQKLKVMLPVRSMTEKSLKEVSKALSSVQKSVKEASVQPSDTSGMAPFLESGKTWEDGGSWNEAVLESEHYSESGYQDLSSETYQEWVEEDGIIWNGGGVGDSYVQWDQIGW